MWHLASWHVLRAYNIEYDMHVDMDPVLPEMVPEGLLFPLSEKWREAFLMMRAGPASKAGLCSQFIPLNTSHMPNVAIGDTVGGRRLLASVKARSYQADEIFESCQFKCFSHDGASQVIR